MDAGAIGGSMTAETVDSGAAAAANAGRRLF
jgi:hypothetical protein